MSSGKTPKNILVNSLGTSLYGQCRSVTVLASQGTDPVFTEVNVLSSSNDSGSSYFPSIVRRGSDQDPAPCATSRIAPCLCGIGIGLEVLVIHLYGMHSAILLFTVNNLRCIWEASRT